MAVLNDNTFDLTCLGSQLVESYLSNTIHHATNEFEIYVLSTTQIDLFQMFNMSVYYKLNLTMYSNVFKNNHKPAWGV